MRNSNKDDPNAARPYIGPAMMEEAQRLYISEVLGATLPPVQVAVLVDLAPLVVATEDLTEFSRSLLNKILASVGITQWRYQELGTEPIPAQHRLLFSGEGCQRKVQGEEVNWIMPSLSQMLGEGPDVTARKKAVWNLLKEFSREFKT